MLELPQPPNKANRKQTRVNISSFAFGEWVLLSSGIRRSVAVTTVMPLDLFFLKIYFSYVVLNKNHRLPTI